MLSPTAEESDKAPATNMAMTGQRGGATLDGGAAADPLYAFYACGFVQDEPSDEEEDTEDELETQSWIRFQRARAQSRLNESCQRERHLQLATK